MPSAPHVTASDEAVTHGSARRGRSALLGFSTLGNCYQHPAPTPPIRQSRRALGHLPQSDSMTSPNRSPSPRFHVVT
jgi:hypothetical protein